MNLQKHRSAPNNRQPKKNLVKPFLFGFFLFSFLGILSAQTIHLTGVVTDGNNEPLPGVSVLKIGTSYGTATSADGIYRLDNVSVGDSIQFSFIGFKTEYHIVSNVSVVNIVMHESSNLMDEVQVIAFQTQKKESVIGSISSISPKELKIAPTNLTAAFAGKLAGVISYQRSGAPGEDNAEFFIRGVATFGYKNNPLILIDGLEVGTNDLARMEPDNIASFSIMKDATATALYGARGANGVILVTTKEGRTGKAKISLRLENSIATPTMTNNFLGGVDYMELYNKALRTRNPNALLFYSKEKIEGTRKGLDPSIYPNVDWYNELFRKMVFNKKANMNINGGGEIAQYYLSVSYTNEKGLLKVDPLNNFNNNIDINRYNMRANVNIKLSKTTRAAVKFYSLFDRYNGPVDDANSIFSSVMQANPVNFPLYYPKDETTQYLNHTLFGNKGNGGMPNPYADMVKGYKDRFSSTILSQFQIEQDLDFITKGLKFRGMASVKNYSMNQNSRSFTPFYYGMASLETESGIQHSLYQIQEGTEFLNDPIVQNIANSSFYFELVTQYNRTFKEKHEVGALLVFTRKESLNTLGGNSYATLPSRNIGLSGRATYSYDNRYYLELNFGYNGSEKFAKNNRFGFFPSAGLGWTVSNEAFFAKFKKAISLLKFKATYGLVGNDAISDPNDRFFYLSNVNLNDGGRGYSFGRDFGNYYPGFIINRYSNPDVSWEIAKKANFGMELSLFDKANLQVDYFFEHRTNIYWAREYTPETMGLTATISSNIGEAKSKGIDISLDYKQTFANNLWITSRLNFTYSTNEILKNGEPQYEYPYMSRIGQPINQTWGLVAERLFIDQNDLNNSPPQYNQGSANYSYMPGDIKYVDVNGDGQIDDRDMVPIGYPTVPEIVYGAGSSAGYKNFDFSFFFQGVAKESFFINPQDIAPFVNERNALQVISENHWSVDNPDPYAFWPRMSTEAVANNEVSSTWWIRNGSFLRLKSIEIGYTFSSKILDKYKIENARLYFNGTNLFTLSKFKLWDPEMAGNGLGYPPQKLFNIGINLFI
jgi:TonB-linked SusC/RagA family outer membrane protein